MLKRVNAANYSHQHLDSYATTPCWLYWTLTDSNSLCLATQWDVSLLFATIHFKRGYSISYSQWRIKDLDDSTTYLFTAGEWSFLLAWYRKHVLTGLCRYRMHSSATATFTIPHYYHLTGCLPRIEHRVYLGPWIYRGKRRMCWYVEKRKMIDVWIV